MKINSKLKIGLFGGSGKMGRAVEQMLQNQQMKQNNQAELFPYLFIGNESSDLFAISAQNIKNIEPVVLSEVNVWIDFSSGTGFLELLNTTAQFKTPIVSGSTGLSESDMKKIKKISKNRKIFWASNMSPGLWAFRQALKGLGIIANFDFAIEEIHHNKKKDSPSGTAKTLRADLEKIINKKIEAPKSFRLGGVFGVHTVLAASSNEVISFQHQALNRTVFAEGALMSATWLVNQGNGFYSMDDLFRKS